MPALAALLGLVAFAYGTLVLLAWAMQSRLLYLPTTTLTGTPRDNGLDYEEVHFSATDAVRLHGWWIPSPRARYTLLFMHGNAGNISDRLPSIRLFHDLGLHVFVFDYRGYGRSSGSPDEHGTYLDARAAWDALVTRAIPAADIVLFGRSLGGPIAATLAAQVQPAALIVESSFTSAPALAATLYPWLPARALLRFRYDTQARLLERSCPLLIVHSDEDELIDYSHAQALLAAAPEPRRLLTIHGSHADGFLTSGGLYRRGISDFIASLP